MSGVSRTRAAVSVLLMACAPAEDWKPSQPGEIFRYTAVGSSPPLDSIRLGELWTTASKYGAQPADTMIALPFGTFGGADAIAVHRNEAGKVTQIDFVYHASRNVDALVADYRQSLGPPSAIESDSAAGRVRTTTRWRNENTEFVINAMSPPDKIDVAAVASLIDRPRRSP